MYNYKDVYAPRHSFKHDCKWDSDSKNACMSPLLCLREVKAARLTGLTQLRHWPYQPTCQANHADCNKEYMHHYTRIQCYSLKLKPVWQVIGKRTCQSSIILLHCTSRQPSKTTLQQMLAHVSIITKASMKKIGTSYADCNNNTVWGVMPSLIVKHGPCSISILLLCLTLNKAYWAELEHDL